MGLCIILLRDQLDLLGTQKLTGKGSSVAKAAAAIPGISEMFAYHATTMANTMRACLLVFTRKVGRTYVHPSIADSYSLYEYHLSTPAVKLSA